MQTITDIRQRLQTAAVILALLDQRRRESGDEHVGAEVERHLIERELEDLARASGPLAEPAAALEIERRPDAIRDIIATARWLRAPVGAQRAELRRLWWLPDARPCADGGEMRRES